MKSSITQQTSYQRVETEIPLPLPSPFSTNGLSNAMNLLSSLSHHNYNTYILRVWECENWIYLWEMRRDSFALAGNL